jgi:hypothetical protein
MTRLRSDYQVCVGFSQTEFAAMHSPVVDYFLFENVLAGESCAGHGFKSH